MKIGVLYLQYMKVMEIPILAASFLSFGTALILVFSGEPSFGFAPAFALAAGVCSLVSYFICIKQRTCDRKNDRPLYEDSLHEEQNPPLSSLMSGLLKTLSESPEEIRRIIDYPLVNEILSVKTERELADLVAIAHQRILKSEKILSILSDRVLTDTKILLPLAEAVIRAVPAKTEEAAFVVMEKFMVVREASSRAAASARAMRMELEDDESDKSINKTAEASRKIVVEERDVIHELSLCTRDNREHLDAMSREIDSGIELLENITDINERSKLIAFNMSIEAARLGEKGKGFKVIVTELHKLNDRTIDFARKVSVLLSRFRDYNKLLVSNMEEKSGAVIAKVERGMNSAESAVESLITASTRTQNLTKDIAIMSESIDHDLDGVLESLQFQDITRQMIEGSLSIIAELKKCLEDCIATNNITVDETVIHERFSLVKNRLIAEAKTKGEKNALMEVQL